MESNSDFIGRIVRESPILPLGGGEMLRCEFMILDIVRHGLASFQNASSLDTSYLERLKIAPELFEEASRIADRTYLECFLRLSLAQPIDTFRANFAEMTWYHRHLTRSEDIWHSLPASRLRVLLLSMDLANSRGPNVSIQ